MVFVCCHFNEMKLKLLSRLYAFPALPVDIEKAPFIILDSGAWGLAQRGKSMNCNYMQRLAEHYSRFQSRNVHCIAPDVYLDPRQTMRNWEWWQTNFPEIKVVPVIQFERERTLDWYCAVRQAEFYAQFHPGFIAVSNPALRASESGVMIEICAAVREITKAKWLHNLGAGWSPDDIAAWRELGCFDSIDSVSYYEDAKRGKCWRRDGKIEICRTKTNWRAVAHHNAEVANTLAEKE